MLAIIPLNIHLLCSVSEKIRGNFHKLRLHFYLLARLPLWNCQPCQETHCHAIRNIAVAFAPFRLHFHLVQRSQQETTYKQEAALILYKPCSEPGTSAGERP